MSGERKASVSGLQIAYNPQVLRRAPTRGRPGSFSIRAVAADGVGTRDGRTEDAPHGNGSNDRQGQAPIPDRGDIGGRRRRRGRRRDAVRDLDVPERAREGRRCAGGSRHLQGRAGPADQGRMARQAVLGASTARQQMLADLPKIDDRLVDPIRRAAAAGVLQERDRSIKPETSWSRSASAPTWAARRPSSPRSAPARPGRRLEGRLLLPLPQSRFDLAGRVFKGVPAPTNLVVPPHRYRDATPRSSSAKTPRGLTAWPSMRQATRHGAGRFNGHPHLDRRSASR